jgi:hypothetical protein
MSLVEKIKDLCEAKDTTLIGLEREIGLGRGTIRNWDKNSPSIDKLQKVAEYFNISADYLLYGFDKALFIQQVNAIRGKMSIEEFSKITGVNEEELLDISRGFISERPSLETVEKINAHNKFEVIFGSLYKAAGYLGIEAAKKDFKNKPLTFDEQEALKQYKHHLSSNLPLDEKAKGYLYETEFQLVTRFRKLSFTAQQTMLNLLDNLETMDKTKNEQASNSEVG